MLDQQMRNLSQPVEEEMPIESAMQQRHLPYYISRTFDFFIAADDYRHLKSSFAVSTSLILAGLLTTLALAYTGNLEGDNYGGIRAAAVLTLAIGLILNMINCARAATVCAERQDLQTHTRLNA